MSLNINALVTGYIREYTAPHYPQLSNDIHHKITTLCHEYLHGANVNTPKNADTDTNSESKKKIRVHLKADDNKLTQFSCFIGPHINDLYDNILFSAKANFKMEANQLNMYHKDSEDGRRSYLQDIGDLIDKLDDQCPKDQYLHLHLEESSKELNPLPYVIVQSETNVLSPSAAKAVQSTQKPALHVQIPDVPTTKPHPLFTESNTNPQKPRISAHFRTISESSSFSFKSASSTESTSSEDTIDPETNPSTDPESDDMLLMEYGYNIMGTIKETFNGCIYEAQSVGSPDKTCDKWLHLKATDAQEHVAIKKVIKDRIDIDGDSIMGKEARVLHYLTVANKAPRDNICAFVELIETETTYFLVEEFGTTMTLNLFTERAHEYMKEGLLLKKDWRVFIKYMFWQLMVNMYWMHYDMRCCHLNLNMDSILLQNVQFVNNDDGLITIDAKCLKIKLCDFSESELFLFNKDQKAFNCIKSEMSSDCMYRSPKAFNGEMFNGIKADVWSLGVILHTMFTGIQPYHYPHASDEGFLALQNDGLVSHLKENGFEKYISKQAVKLMKNALNVDEDKRLDTQTMLRCEWFSNYYEQQHIAIKKKSKTQRLRHMKQKSMMKQLPFYRHKLSMS